MQQEKINILENIIYDSLKNHVSVSDEEKKQMIKLINFYYTSNKEFNTAIKETWEKAEAMARNSTVIRAGKQRYALTKMFYAKKNYLTQKSK